MPALSEKIREEFQNLVKEQLSVELATVSHEAVPAVSYAPFVAGRDLAFYVFLSDLAIHTSNIKNNSNVSVMVIEDEKTSSNLFARERLILDCVATRHERDSEEFKEWIPKYKERFGAIVDTLVQLADFNLYSLKPNYGVYVKGFGQAYRITGNRLDKIEHITNPARDAAERNR